MIPLMHVTLNAVVTCHLNGICHWVFTPVFHAAHGCRHTCTIYVPLPKPIK